MPHKFYPELTGPGTGAMLTDAKKAELSTPLPNYGKPILIDTHLNTTKLSKYLVTPLTDVKEKIDIHPPIEVPAQKLVHFATLGKFSPEWATSDFNALYSNTMLLKEQLHSVLESLDLSEGDRAILQNSLKIFHTTMAFSNTSIAELI